MYKKYTYVGTIIMALIVMTLLTNTAYAEQRSPNNNSYWVNKIIMDAVNAKSADDIIQIANLYWSNWHDQWLNKFALYAFGIQSKQLWNKLTPEQQDKVKAVIKDGTSEDNLFIGATCGIEKGDSCSEDYISMAMVAAMTKNLYPNIADEIGLYNVNNLEKKFIEKTFSTNNGWYGLIKEKLSWDDKKYIKMYNHGEENPVYAGVVIIGLNNARFTYLMARKPLPSYYRNQNIVYLFQWTQTKVYNDGHMYLDNACHTVDGNVVPCNDIKVSKAIPKVIPAGRFIKMVFGESAFIYGKYKFLQFNSTGASGNFNLARLYFYNTWNPLHYFRIRKVRTRAMPLPLGHTKKMVSSTTSINSKSINNYYYMRGSKQYKSIKMKSAKYNKHYYIKSSHRT